MNKLFELVKIDQIRLEKVSSDTAQLDVDLKSAFILLEEKEKMAKRDKSKHDEVYYNYREIYIKAFVS